MSSILKALKKLEEKETEPRGLQIWLSPQGRRRLLKGPVLIVAALLLVAGVGLGVYRLRSADDAGKLSAALQPESTPKPSSRHRIAVQPKTKTPPQPTPRITSKTAQPRPAVAPTQTAKPSRTTPQVSRPTPQPSKKPIQAARPAPQPTKKPAPAVRPAPQPSKKPTPAARPAPTPAVSPQRAPQTSPPAASPATTPTPQATVAAKAPAAAPKPAPSAAKPAQPTPIAPGAAVQRDRLNDPKIEIQAISWTPEPESRLVVINSRILREGSTVEGYRVAQINPDDVILVRGGREYSAELILR